MTTRRELIFRRIVQATALAIFGIAWLTAEDPLALRTIGWALPYYLGWNLVYGTLFNRDIYLRALRIPAGEGPVFRVFAFFMGVVLMAAAVAFMVR